MMLVGAQRVVSDRSIPVRFGTSRQVSRTLAPPARKLKVCTSGRPYGSRTIFQAADAGAAQSTAAATTVLYVTQLDASIRGDELATHFKSQPGFDSAFVMNVDDEGGQQQYMGYVQFESPQAAAAAQKALDGSELRQKRIRVRTQRSSSSRDADEDDSSAAAASPGESHASATSQESLPSDSSSSEASEPAATAVSSSFNPGTPTSDSTGAGNDTKQLSKSAKYRQRQNAKKEAPPPASPNVLFVPNMKPGTTEEQLQQVFRDQAGYQRANIRLFSGRRPDGYVTFDSEDAAAAAMEAVNGTSLNDKLLKVFVHTGYNKDAAAAMAAADAAQPKEKQQQAKRERVSNKKGAPATSTAGPDSAGDSNESSTKGDEIKPKRQQQRRAVTYDLKVQGLAWTTTAEGLAQHFSDCKGFLRADTTLNADERPSGLGYVKFDAADAALAALQAKDGSELDGRAIKVLITSKEASKFEAAATAKDGGGSSGSNGGSSVSRRLGGKAAFALQVFNLAWEVTDADLVEHFQECPGFTGAFIVTGPDNRPSGQGYVTFDSQAAQLDALKAKQNSDLVGRSVSLRTTRPGRVESGAAKASSGSSGAAKDSEVVESADLVLMGLPSSFTYKEALGLCSYFGGVKKVERMRKGSPQRADTNTGSSSSSSDSAAGAQDSASASDAAAEADAARAGQPCFVHMESVGAAAAAVRGLNGRVIQGCKVAAAFAAPKAPKDRRRKQAAEAEPAQAAVAS